MKGEISQWEVLPEGSRFDVQQALYRMMGGEGELFTLYQPTRQENASVVGTGEGLTWVSRAEGGDGPSRLVYQVEVQGRQALYFDAFRDLSTRLTEPINDSFAIKVNGRSAAESYPAKRNNGLLYLGLFENEPVTVEVEVLKDVSLASFGLGGPEHGSFGTGGSPGSRGGASGLRAQVYRPGSGGGGGISPCGPAL